MATADAATVVLLDGTVDFRVLLLRRSGTSGFLANAYVFPGGRVDPSDASAGTRGDLNALLARMPSGTTRADATARLAAAARETFEESGMLLVASNELLATDIATARAELNAGRETWLGLLSRWDAAISADELVLFDHWLTPVGQSRSFSAFFFAAVVGASEAASASHDEQETVESVWLTPAEAIARHRDGTLLLAPPTLMVLRDLAQFETSAAVMAWARRRNVVPIRPTIARDATGLSVVFGDAWAQAERGPGVVGLTWCQDHWEDLR